jgi:Trypsin-co-occurring domain 1
MAEVIEIELPDGEVILAEVSIMDKDVGALDRFDLKNVSLSAARIGGAVHTALRRALLQAMPGPPARIGIDIGLKLAVKSGVLTSVLAEAAGEASITVRLDWEAQHERE